MQGYKTGAKQQDINKIRKMNEEGKSVDEISRALLIIPGCIHKFVEFFNAQQKPKKARSTKSAKAAKAPKPEAKPTPIEPDEPIEELPSMVGQSEV